MSSLLASLDLTEAAEVIKNSKRIFVAGNGGSASISDHLCCDFEKGAGLPTISLIGRLAVLTAYANDCGYETVFIKQLEAHNLTPWDSVVLISSSGNSPNIVNAGAYTKDRGANLIGLTGFSGGQLLRLADVSIHIPFDNYGVVEDCHQAVMHILSQYIRETK